MKKRERKLAVILILFIVLSSIFVFLNLVLFSDNLSLTGKASDSSGGVDFSIGGKKITIHHPENKSYYFNKTDEDYYTPIFPLELEVSSNFVSNDWRYYLEQTTPSGDKNSFSSGIFTPNITMLGYRWGNALTVYAKDSEEVEFYEIVRFEIRINNSAPEILNFSPEFYVCENNALNFPFNASDRDEDSMSASVSPINPFYMNLGVKINSTIWQFRLTSRNMTKQYVGGNHAGNKTYSPTVYVSDGYHFDSKTPNITVIEINNRPSFENIGVQTVWARGENSTFFRQAEFFDIEDENSSQGNLDFSIQYFNSANLFSINQTGWMNFTANSSHLGPNNSSVTYNISVCAEDNGIQNPYYLIQEKCNQTGGNLISCNNFSLTVTNENRAPIVIYHYPENLTMSVVGLEMLYFNVSAYDPDGTIPDIYWYVDGVQRKYTSGNFSDEFEYSFGCNVYGLRRVKVVATDGLLNDSVEWLIDVTNVPCPTQQLSGGGGGGFPTCEVDWKCGDWNICQNLDVSLEKGELKGESYREIKKECDNRNLNTLTCGFQIRDCFDFNNCSSFYRVPPQIQSCYYVENPGCSDGIKNCHSGGCEVGVDCGGPCGPCPTCSDKIQNQGEEGVDCGGPCPWSCPPEPKADYRLLYLVLLIILILLIILLVKLIKILKYRKEIENKNAS
jgi:hypothetical protein